MKFDKQIETFISLRIEGNSFDSIATVLKTTKQTLIEWNKQLEVKDTINDGKAIRLNTLVKTFEFDVTTRAKRYLELSKKINEELLSRDLKEVSTETLLKMSVANDNRIKDLVNKNIQIGKNDCFVNMEGDGFFNFQLDE